MAIFTLNPVAVCLSGLQQVHFLLDFLQMFSFTTLLSKKQFQKENLLFKVATPNFWTKHFSFTDLLNLLSLFSLFFVLRCHLRGPALSFAQVIGGQVWSVTRAGRL